MYSSILIGLGKLFGKRSILILGGVDVAKIPELKYGIWNSKWKSIIVRYGITHADVILAVDPSIKNDAIALARYDGHNIRVLPTGHDELFWKPGKDKKRHIVLTVAVCSDQTRFKIKGLDFLYSVADAMPDIQFVLVGLTEAMKEQFIPPANIESHDTVPQEALLSYYQQATVYFQPSRREALGSTICESMLCECYPVGTNIGGIPNVIGNTGSIVPFGDVHAAVNEIRSGMQKTSMPDTRQHIIDNFSMRKRSLVLTEIISALNVQ